MTFAPPALIEAIAELWRLPPPGPENLLAAQAFTHLRQTCEQLYPTAGSKDALSFALHHALRAFGLPCGLPSDKQHLSLSTEDAAYRLDQAFCTTQTSRIHLCPLDCADTLPPLAFGQASVRMLTASELEALVNLPQLQRNYPSWKMDSQRLASFTWLIVEEEARLIGEPGQRAMPMLYENLDQDFGAIEPHQQRFPPAVEAALFTLLLAPWEQWVQYNDIDWRPFRTPWVYTTDNDVFTQRPVPPSSDTLSWEPCIYHDRYGDEVESERPVDFPLSDAAADAASWVNDAAWAEVLGAKRALIFGSPVAHFLIRAFLSSGIDEFLAHITVIEAALGTRIDHDARNRPKLKGDNPGATSRVAIRLSALLGDKAHSTDFRCLFDARSEFLHGRTMRSIASSDKVLARKLARQVARELVKVATCEPTLPREVFLQRLLDAGLNL
jgi:hypothetical protein